MTFPNVPGDPVRNIALQMGHTVVKQSTFDQRFNDAFAKAWFEKRLEDAVKKVINGIKEESIKAV